MTTRPLSPHLQIYRPQITSVLSILHRITGGLLSVSALLLAYWLLALAGGEDSYATAQAVFSSWLGMLVLFLVTLAFCYHFCNGVRHLFWDAGKGFELASMQRSGIAVVIVSAVMAAGLWIVILTSGG